jgi:hypothetical protein
MSYLHLASTANSSSSSTPSSFLHVNSNGGVSTIPSSLTSSSSSLLGSIGGGKQWTTIGQPSSTLTQQLLMKQPNLLNIQQTTSSHFDGILGPSSSQTQIEKNVKRKINFLIKMKSFLFFEIYSLNYNKKISHHYLIEILFMNQHHHLLRLIFNYHHLIINQ